MLIYRVSALLHCDEINYVISFNKPLATIVKSNRLMRTCNISSMSLLTYQFRHLMCKFMVRGFGLNVKYNWTIKKIVRNTGSE
jgi:hypothetical protein